MSKQKERRELTQFSGEPILVSSGESASPEVPIREAGTTKTRWGRTTLLLIFIILLLFLLWALFWPVKNEMKKAVKPATVQKGPGIVGQARYKAVSAEKVIELGGLHTASWIVIVNFQVENLADEPRVLDYSHIKLVDNVGVEHPASPGLTNRLYKLSGKNSPWEIRIRPGRAYNVRVIFGVSESEREYSLAGRDLSWRARKFIKLPLVTRQKTK